MTDLLLVRHATNDWVGERLAGWTPGVHLNEQGQAQAAALAARLAGWPIEAIYSSPLERAMETAEPLATQCGLPMQILDGVGETRYGEWTGQALKELAKRPEWMRIQVNPSGAYFPQGEGLAEMQARMVAALGKVEATHPKGVVVVVSHADPIKSAIAHYAGIHLDLFQRIVVNPASVTWIKLTPHGPRVMCVNDTGDLQPPKVEEEPAAAADDQPDAAVATQDSPSE